MLTQVLAKLETSQTDREALMLVFIKQLLAERLALQKRITELENDTRDRISDDDVKTIERISAREVQSFADIASMQRNTFPTVLN